jgi:MFS transporter, DHA1 family, tetracycline resistance protein
MKKKFLLITLLVILAIDAINFGLVLPVLPKLFLGDTAVLVSGTMALPLRYSLMGLALGIYPVAVFFATPILGVFSDRYGRKPVLLFALSGTFIGLVLSSVAIAKASLLLFVLSRVLIGISAASQPIAQASVADMTDANNRGIYLSLVAFAMTVGMLAGPLLGGFLSDQHLYHRFSMTTPFIVAAVLAALNLMFMVFNFRETLPSGTREHQALRAYADTVLKYCREIKILHLFVLFLLLELSWSLFFQTQPMHLATLFGYTSEMQSLYVTFLGGVMCFGLGVLCKPLLKRYALRQIIFYTLLINTLSYLCVLISPPWIGAWILSIPFVLGVGICYTALVTALSLHVDPAHQGWLMSFTTALLALAWAVTGLLGPSVLSTQAYLPLLLCVFMSFLGLFLSLLRKT